MFTPYGLSIACTNEPAYVITRCTYLTMEKACLHSVDYEVFHIFAERGSHVHFLFAVFERDCS